MKTKNQWNKEGLIYGIGGGVLGSMLTASGIVLISAFEGPVITNAVTLTAGLGGGIISGALTLFGVRRTIELQKEKEYKAAIPQKILALHKLEEIVLEYHSKIRKLIAIEYMNKEDENHLVKYNSLMEDFQEGFNGLEYSALTEALKTNEKVYRIVRDALFLVNIDISSLYGDKVLYNSSIEKCIEFTEVQSKAKKLMDEMKRRLHKISVCVNDWLTIYTREMFE
ncbi:hypothetical protein [Bacillus toyonensis]|uniref:Uncharacterized protein n=1 Tax=Bacillus toyonensis TaxID=155322 RepID=A0ABX6G2A6_9BACI|nr:hypothetical protein [Bacillus toyonensis]MED2737878.1 hypothetical protein [Bacillus toyonensis]QHA15984.1 hypothetical protein GPA05_02790 [Bacillus toyonensis]